MNSVKESSASMVVSTTGTLVSQLTDAASEVNWGLSVYGFLLVLWIWPTVQKTCMIPASKPLITTDPGYKTNNKASVDCRSDLSAAGLLGYNGPWFLCTDSKEYAGSVKGCIHFCNENILTKRAKKALPNRKTWTNHTVKAPHRVNLWSAHITSWFMLLLVSLVHGLSHRHTSAGEMRLCADLSCYTLFTLHCACFHTCNSRIQFVDDCRSAVHLKQKESKRLGSEPVF